MTVAPLRSCALEDESRPVAPPRAVRYASRWFFSPGACAMPSEKKVRVAIIGLGFGAEFIPIYKEHPNAEIVAVCRLY